MRIFVTGAAGQVGSHVVDSAIARGDEVVGIDNFATGRDVHVAASSQYKFVNGSISDSALVSRLIGEFKPDVIVHTAAAYKDPDDWLTDVDTNIRGMVNLVNAAKEYSVGRFVYFQTALIYGVKPDENPVSLQHPRRVDNSSYSISKGAAEDYLVLSGIDYVTFRLANVVGPRNVAANDTDVPKRHAPARAGGRHAVCDHALRAVEDKVRKDVVPRVRGRKAEGQAVRPAQHERDAEGVALPEI